MDRGTSVRSRRLGLEMKEVFGPGGALERALPEYEPRPEQAALAGAVEHALATGEHLVAEAGTGVGKSLAYLLPALESGQRVVVATATKALQEQLLHQDVPIAAPRARARADRRRAQGAPELPLPPAAAGLPAVPAAPRGATRAPGRRCRAGSTRPRPATGPSCELEPSEALWAELAVGGDRCAGRRCPFVSACFAEAARDRAGEADLVIANHALYFAHVAVGRRRAARARRRRSSTRRTGSRSRPRRGSAAASRAPALRRLALDVERACRDAQKPLPARAARPGRARGRAAAARGRAGRRPASGCARCPPSLRSCSSTRSATWRARSQGQGEDLDALARRALGVAAQVEACLEAGRARARRLVGARRARLGAGRRLGRAARAAVGGRADGDARLRDADDRRGRALRAAPARARPRARGGRRLALRLRRAGAALPAAGDARPAQRRLHRARRRGDRLAARALGGARARAHVELPRARRAIASGCAAASRTTCSCRARRRASGCSSASATRSARCCSRRRRSGRASTCPASRSRCS